ncbi:MAG: hypothetical protein HYX94_01695 [Chloroflexi bacterium]|nr:hypothetical protein [Chloroflexota bacterium]
MKLSHRAASGFGRWFEFEALIEGPPIDCPSALIATWLRAAWRLGKVVVPVLVVGAIVTSAIVAVLPAPASGPLGIVAAAAFGTLVMVPTWTELPIALALVQQGLPGPAATLLLTLPAVSIPCLVIVGAATARYRVAGLLGAVVFVIGVAAGLGFGL